MTGKNAAADRARFARLKKMFRAAPLSGAELAELKDLAGRFDKKMRAWMDENPELC